MVFKKGNFIKLAGVILALMLMGGVSCSGNSSDLEKEIQSLKEELQSVEDIKLDLQRIKDVHAISNIIVKQAYLYEAGMDEERFEYFAKKTPGVTVERSGRGVYEGVDGAYRTQVITEKFFQNLHAQGMRMTYPEHEFTCEVDGYLEAQLVASPVIEVAGDGKTAKAVWLQIVFVNKTYAEVAEPKDMTRLWFWNKNAADFVKEDGEWKIWHYVMGHFIAGRFDENGAFVWPHARPIVEPGEGSPRAVNSKENNWALSPPGGKGLGHGAGPADRGSSKVAQMGYSLDKAPGWFPKPPEPYETFDEKDAYVYPTIPGMDHTANYSEEEQKRWSDPDAVKKWKEQGFDFK